MRCLPRSDGLLLLRQPPEERARSPRLSRRRRNRSKAEISPTMGSRTQVDLTVAVVDAVLFSRASGTTPLRR